MGANALNRRQQAALTSAYALVQSSYKEYKDKLKELYGEEAHNAIVDSIAKEKCKDISISANGGWYDSSLDFGEGMEAVMVIFIGSTLIITDSLWMTAWRSMSLTWFLSRQPSGWKICKFAKNTFHFMKTKRRFRFMNNAKLVKILGLVATAVGMGATLLTDWVNEKKMEEKIDERINEKLAALSDEEDEES